MDKNLFKSLIKAHKQITLEVSSIKFFKTTVIYSINENGDVYELDEIDPMYRAKLFNIEDDKMLQAFYDEILCDVVSHNLIDPRLQLTKEQEKLVKKIRNLLSQMQDAHIETLLNDDGFLMFYNGKQVDDIHWPENTTEENYRMPINVLDFVELGAVKIGYDDEFMGIEFND